jgi:predicted kinase
MRTRQTKEAVLNLEQQKKRSRELLRAIRSGSAEVLAQLQKCHVRWAGVNEAAARREVALHDAQFAIAREQGFASWTKEPSAEARHTRLFVADLQ